jgi:uncharacterized membrane protein (DUF485 family)
LVVHPVLGNKRSRFILFTYLFIGLLSNGAMWWLALRMLKDAHVFIFYRSFQPGWIAGLLTSPIVHVAVALISILIGAAMTSIYVVGPVKRLEQWLKDWRAGHKLAPFKVRDKDYLYENIASLINQLHDKNAQK